MWVGALSSVPTWGSQLRKLGHPASLGSRFQSLNEATKEATHAPFTSSPFELATLRPAGVAVPVVVRVRLLPRRMGSEAAREREARHQLKAQREAQKKAQADNAEAVKEIEDLKKQLTERGMNLENISASLAEQKKALEEYARRTEQLDAIRKRFELLSAKLQKLTQLGLQVEVRNNRMLIQPARATCSSIPARTS